MPSTTLKRRWTEERMKGKAPVKKQRFKKQRFYDSSEDEGGAAEKDYRPYNDHNKDGEKLQKPTNAEPKLKAKIVTKKIAKEDSSDGEEDVSSENLDDLDDDMEVDEFDEDSDASEGSDLSATSTNNPRKTRKRHDPEAFATSMSKILKGALTTQKRSEPILALSKDAREAQKTLADHKLTLSARREVLAEKRAAQEKGHDQDILGLGTSNVDTGSKIAQEKALRRTAQKGVIKLFNAVRAAQVKAEQAEREAKAVVGIGKREERVKEMSKQGFLEMITGAKQKEGSVEA